MFNDVIPDGMHRVRLSQTGIAVKEQRIIGFSGGFRDSERGSLCQVIILADHKGVKGVPCI